MPMDLTGQTYGRFTVISFAGHRGDKRIWNVKCSCGKDTVVLGEGLRSGNTTSCGCKRSEGLVVRNKRDAKVDGLTQTSTGKIWRAMLRRCYCQKDSCYHLYGARGINVCEFLRVAPTNLISIIGERPHDMSIDRKDSNDGYHCGICAECLRNGWINNIRWATSLQQGRNTRSNVRVTINGETKCLSEWAEISGRDSGTISKRLRKGITGIDLLSPNKIRVKKPS